MVKITPGRILWIKGIIHFISTAFFLQLLWLVFNNGFGADPVKGIEHFTGKAALNSLLVTLCITPLVRTFRLSMLVRVRRLLGLYSFSWAFLHLAVYTGLDLNFDWQLLAEEIINRPYLLFGAASWLILFCWPLHRCRAFRGNWESTGKSSITSFIRRWSWSFFTMSGQ